MFISVFALICLNKTPTETLQRILIIKLIIYKMGSKKDNLNEVLKKNSSLPDTEFAKDII